MFGLKRFALVFLVFVVLGCILYAVHDFIKPYVSSKTMEKFNEVSGGILSYGFITTLITLGYFEKRIGKKE